MQIRKEYKAYMGHRNQELKGICRNPHGHLYKIFIYFNVERTGAISTLFEDFDSKIEPLLKNEYDHRFLIDKNDKLLKYFKLYESAETENLGLKVLNFPTSVENLSFQLFSECIKLGFNVDKIELQETNSSTLIYYFSDYIKDNEQLSID